MPKIVISVEIPRTDGRKEVKTCSFEGEFNTAEDSLTAIILESPNGSKWHIKVSDTGTISAEPVS